MEIKTKILFIPTHFEINALNTATKLKTYHHTSEKKKAKIKRMKQQQQQQTECKTPACPSVSECQARVRYLRWRLLLQELLSQVLQVLLLQLLCYLMEDGIVHRVWHMGPTRKNTWKHALILLKMKINRTVQNMNTLKGIFQKCYKSVTKDVRDSPLKI